MSYSTVAYSSSAVSKPKRGSRKSVSQNFLGGAAIAALVLGSAWTVYANVFRADVYPQLGSANFDAPVVTRPAVAARPAQTVVSDAFAALREQAPPAAAPAALAPSSTPTFDDRFAAAAPQGVEPKSQPETPKVAEAPKPQRETAKLADAAKPRSEAPKLAEAPKAKAPVQVAALPPQSPADAPADKSPAAAVRDMAQRAKAAVMSLASNERRSISEKLWGKQPSRGSLLAYASADASVTGSLGQNLGPDLGQNQNPALGGSAPYDRSTAVYDISAHTVYLPDGAKLEAHSGLGSELDDPRSARIRMRGVTPPHIYELKPREALFHGVPALRLTPIGGEDAIYGRSGLLAHTYMLGPNGDSNGCVSFRDYNAFLNAYRNQGIKRLAVVARVE
jgi:type VI secretion system (T6SS) effector TldE1-like protein